MFILLHNTPCRFNEYVCVYMCVGVFVYGVHCVIYILSILHLKWRKDANNEHIYFFNRSTAQSWLAATMVVLLFFAFGIHVVTHVLHSLPHLSMHFTMNCVQLYDSAQLQVMATASPYHNNSYKI